jgi:branched-chain amino acid transport system permease protein
MITSMVVFEQIMNGLVLGCMYASVASGLTLIWGTMKMLNFAHGEFYMLGGYVLYFALTVFGVPPLIALVLAVGIVLFLGMFTEKLVIHPLLDRPGWELSPLMVTIGISIFLQNLALRLWGERFKNVPYFLDGTFDLFGIRMAYQRLIIFVVTASVMLGFWAVLKKTKFGIGLRATAQDRDAATLMGVNAKKIYTITFGISCAMAALAAALLAPIFSVNPWMGHAALIKGFITVVLGGLGSFEGAILGGFILGTTESISVILLSSEWKDVVAFAIFILVLIVRPSGLFGTKEW